jgi:hypothetical protein
VHFVRVPTNQADVVRVIAVELAGEFVGDLAACAENGLHGVCPFYVF